MPKRSAAVRDAAISAAAAAAAAAPPSAKVTQPPSKRGRAGKSGQEPAPENVTEPDRKRHRGSLANDAPARSIETAEASRPRWAAEEALRDCIIGFIDDAEEDPRQSGITKPRQSAEIQELVNLGHEVPVAKDRRADFVWVVAARDVRRGKDNEEAPEDAGERKRAKKYTWNVDEMAPLSVAKRPQDGRCDVCGAECTEVLYEFRCYRRQRRNAKGPIQERRLHPFVSYISKECGRGLLGVQSEASKLREQLYRVVSGDGASAVETLRELWRHAAPAMRRVITDELRHFARTEAGESQRGAEFRKAEALHGPLHRVSMDIFRGVAHATGPILGARELAAVSVRYAMSNGIEMEGGYLKKLADCLRERQPIAYAPTPWPRSDVTACIHLLVRAWPLRVELLDSLTGTEVFHHHKKTLLSVRLVYLPGCGQIHALLGQRAEKDTLVAMKTPLQDQLKVCKELFWPMQSIHGQRNPSKAEDRAIEIPPQGSIESEHVRKALDSITWPNCFTRNNVKPDDAPFIHAFPLGVVLNYALGLCPSRATKLWPNLTKLLTAYLKQSHPNFQYTTIQLNRNYAAKMHVDGNNHGPSYIIGLGDYTGGDLWIQDDKGTVPATCPCVMKGYPSMRPGQTVMGRLVSCKNKWVKFDGNHPHMAMPYTGERMSIVFFTRRGWLKLGEEATGFLNEVGFTLPDQDFMASSTVKEDAPEETQPDMDIVEQPKAEAAAKTEEDEVDEDEEVDAVMREELDGASWRGRDWAKVLKDRLGLDWGATSIDEAAPLEVCCGPGVVGAACTALEELLESFSGVRALCAEPDAPTLRYARKNCQLEHAFAKLHEATAGAGHCEVHHRAVKTPAARPVQDIFVGTFSSAPFVNRDASRAGQSCFDDPRAHRFLELRQHIETRRPYIAVLDIDDFGDLSAMHRPSVLRFLLDGRDPRSDSPWGLRLLSQYALAVAHLRMSELGVPLAGVRTHLILFREDCGGSVAAEQAARLAQALAGSLPPCAVQDLMFDEDDLRLLEIRRAYWKISEKPADDRLSAAATKSANKALSMEMKELSLKPGEVPYTDFLKRELGSRYAEWFPHATPSQVLQLNFVYVRARQNGVDLDGIVVDISQGAPRRWRDDGRLPSSGEGAPGPSAGPFYSFAKHRPLTGQELLLCKGYPVWRLNFQGLSDSQALHVGAHALPVPAVGATLCAALATADLGPGRRFRAKPASAAALIANAQEGIVQAGAASVAEAEATAAGEASTTDDSEEAQFEGRAVALLNLVSHGSFAQEEPDMSEGKATEGKRKPAEVTRSIMSALTHVAEEEDNPTEGGVPTKATVAIPPDEPRDWPTRLRKLKVNLDSFSVGAAIRWVQEAMDDPEASLAHDIMDAGISCLKQRASQSVPEDAMRARVQLVERLRGFGRESDANELDELFRTSKFLEGIAKGDSRLTITGQTPETMPRYVIGVVQGCSRNGWPMRRAFLDHLGKVAMTSRSNLEEFGRHGGWEPVAEWLREAPADLQAAWPGGAAIVESLGRVAPAAQSRLLVALHGAACQFDSDALRGVRERLEGLLVEAVSPMLGKKVVQKDIATPAQALLEELADQAGSLGERFARTATLVAAARRVRQSMKEGKGLELDEVKRLQKDFNTESATKRALPATEQAGPWNKLIALETSLVQAVQRTLAQRAEEAAVKDSRRQREAEDVRAQRERQSIEAQGRELSAMLTSDRLKVDTTEGLAELMTVMQGLRAAIDECPPPTPSSALAALEKAAIAAKRFGERPIRELHARSCLRNMGFAHCAEILATHRVLDRLHELPAAPEMLKKKRLPKNCQEALLEAAAKGMFRERSLSDSDLPPGWERKLSRTKAGVHYFQKSGGAAQWEWPVPTPVPEESLQEPPEPPEPTCMPPGSFRDGAAAYIEHSEGDVFCLLCCRPGRSHFACDAHARARRCWASIGEQFKQLQKDLEDEHSLMDGSAADHTLPGLASCWRSDLQLVIAKQQVPALIEMAFWHRAVKPHLPTVDTGKAVLASLEAILKSAHAAEDVLGPDTPEVRLPTPSGATREASRALRGFLTSSGRLRNGTRDGLTELLNATQRLRTSAGAAKHLPGIVEDSLCASEAAVRFYCERPLRNSRAQRWLQRHGLQHCVKLLEAHSLLDRMHELGQSPVAASAGLPPSCERALHTATACGHLSEASLAAGAEKVPPGWGRIFSKSTGMHYFQEVAGQRRSQWEWPVVRGEPAASAASSEEPPEPKPPPGAQLGVQVGPVPYVEIDGDGEPLCYLCGDIGHRHLDSEAHQAAVANWSLLCGRVQELRDALLQAAPLREPEAEAGLVEAWLGEVLRVVQQSEVPERIKQTYWHKSAKPCLSERPKKANMLIKALEAMTDSSIIEPHVERHDASDVADAGDGAGATNVDLEPGVDFPVFPKPLAVTGRLTETTPPEVLNALSVEALLGEGIEVRNDGVLWCGYCEDAVQSLHQHLCPKFEAAKIHMLKRSAMSAVIERLLSEGGQLRDKGIKISKRMFHCRTCKVTGSWSTVWDHFDSDAHARACNASGGERHVAPHGKA